jgi:hypothetical protein
LNCHSFLFLKVSGLSRILTSIFTCMFLSNFRIQRPMTGKSGFLYMFWRTQS